MVREPTESTSVLRAPESRIPGTGHPELARVGQFEHNRGVESRAILIAGAGPAGLMAAIVAANAGARVIVYESRQDVGLRFHGDFQGIENWTLPGDALEELESLGLERSFEYSTFHAGTFFSATGRRRMVPSSEPAFYLVRRGPQPDTLDQALRVQAQAAGVEIRFGQKLEDPSEADIWAVGPSGRDAIDVGYLFETSMPDSVFGVLDNRLAPGGYAYVLIREGRGTLASCMFNRFEDRRACLDRTVAFFEERIGLEMKNRRFFGGAGNFSLPKTGCHGGTLFVGEAAGFQDALWGFGIRSAMISGALAARAILSGHREEYDRMWQERLGGLIRGSLVNAFFYRRIGNRGYAALLARLEKSRDARRWLMGFYRPTRLKNALSRVLPV